MSSPLGSCRLGEQVLPRFYSYPDSSSPPLGSPQWEVLRHTCASNLTPGSHPRLGSSFYKWEGRHCCFQSWKLSTRSSPQHGSGIPSNNKELTLLQAERRKPSLQKTMIIIRTGDQHFVYQNWLHFSARKVPPCRKKERHLGLRIVTCREA